MATTELAVASQRFEAARQLDGLRAMHRRGSLHGHGFIASVRAHVPVDWAAFQGSGPHDLQDRLGQCVNRLDYGLLNDVMDSPTDETVASWIAQRIDVPGVERVAVQSTPNQGSYIAAGGSRVHTWRRYTFRAAHRLPYVPVGHKCGRLHGHGFAIVVHTVRNLSDPGPGYDEIDALWAPLQSALNFRCLNDLPGLDNPTSEILSSWVWDRLKPSCPSLSAVTVFETGSCGATFEGTRYRIWKDFTLDSAVRMASAPADDPRYQIHGHTYALRLNLSAPLDFVMGWTIDFGDVKAIFDPVFKALDHHPLHEQPELADGDTTSIARWIHRRTLADLPQLASVELYETEGCGAIVGESARDPGLPL